MNVRIGKSLCLASLALSLTACSKSPQRYLASGDEYFKAGKYKEAILQYRNAVQRDPKLAKAHFQLAKAYAATQVPDEAFKELQTTVDLDPGNVEAQLQYASVLLAAKKYDDLQAVLAKLLAAEPNNAKAHALSGGRLAMTGDLPGAIREFQTAIKQDPRQVGSYMSLASIYMSRGELSDAEAVFNRAPRRTRSPFRRE
jgi:tetratricopeptide (TPR) repeat protein